MSTQLPQTPGGDQTGSFYDQVGGHETFRKLVHEFYRGVAGDPALRALYPEQDLGPAEDRLRLFLEQPNVVGVESITGNVVTIRVIAKTAPEQQYGVSREIRERVKAAFDANGVVWYIRNGEIVRIGNKSQGWATALVDIPVAYSENLERVIPLIRSVVHALDESPEWQDKLLEEPNVVGVESMTGTSVTIRVVAKTAPQEQYGVSREIRERVKAAFDEHGIKAPAFTPFGPPAR